MNKKKKRKKKRENSGGNKSYPNLTFHSDEYDILTLKKYKLIVISAHVFLDINFYHINRIFFRQLQKEIILACIFRSTRSTF